MHALTFSRFGGPEVLEYHEVPSPQPQPGHVTVSLRAISLNFADIYRRQGRYHLAGHPPYIAGHEAAGVIESVPPDSTFRPGDRVASNALLADQFLEYFDGFSIGSNDLTQLTLALDRDSGLVADLFDEQNEAVQVLMAQAISAAKRAGKYVGICGQGPSDHPALAQWLVEQGIDSLSLNPDSVLNTWNLLTPPRLGPSQTG